MRAQLQWCMLLAVDPLLHRIEAVPEPNCYSVTVLLDGNRERSMIMKVTDPSDEVDGVHVPEANMIAGWLRSSDSFRAVLDAVRAFDRARNGSDGVGPLLRDVPGGWDVSVGNVVLDADGRPECVAHGPLEPVADPDAFDCATCGAQALFASASR